MTAAQWWFLAVLAAIEVGAMVAVAVMARRSPVDPRWAADEALAMVEEER